MTLSSINESIQATATAINESLSRRGGFYAQYSAKLVSWDDVSRATVGSSLSCWGANITDTYLKTKEGASLFTVRSDNWNEKLGVIRASDVALLTGNCDEGSVSAKTRPITLEQFLEAPALHGAAYTGISPTTSLSCPEADGKVSIRFQTVFLPLPEADHERIQFSAEAYNYNTSSDENPRNMIILASSQGIAVQCDGAGKKRLFHHGRESFEGAANAYWLEAEASKHAVGASQDESAAERQDALSRGKATSETIGIRAMGRRFNTLLTVQVPLKQDQERLSQYLDLEADLGLDFFEEGIFDEDAGDDEMLESEGEEDIDFDLFDEPIPNISACTLRGSSHSRMGSVKIGRASAARVSRGDSAGTLQAIKKSEPQRDRSEHVTVTVVMYHTVNGGVPSENDVALAIDDLEKMYASCTESGRLADAAFKFMTAPLTVQDAIEICHKVSTQMA